MKLYTEEQVNEMLNKINALLPSDNKESLLKYAVEHITHYMTPIELPSDEEIIGKFMNWFIKHYSTAVIDGMFGYVNAIEDEVTIREILDDYFNKSQILNQNK